MPLISRKSFPFRCRLTLGLATALLAGCTAPSSTNWTSAVLEVPSDWNPLSAAEVASETTVPGDPLGGWMSPGGSTLIVAYRSLPMPGATPQSFAEEMRLRLSNLPGVEALAAKTISQNGVEFTWVEAVAPGNGRAWALSSLGTSGKSVATVPTRMITLTYGKPEATLSLAAYFPEQGDAGVRSNAEQILKSWNPTRIPVH